MTLNYPCHILCFSFNNPATTDISTLSLHDALPIFSMQRRRDGSMARHYTVVACVSSRSRCCSSRAATAIRIRSEEHTSELQSQSNLVCRLLLEKKNSDEIHRIDGAIKSTHPHFRYD